MTRIYTEDVNREGVQSILDSTLNGYTLIPAIGRWRGITEQSLIIEIAGARDERIDSIASRIKTLNHQQAVMIVDPHGNEYFV